MQAYQSAPCPYCGITWNQPGAQTCANCRNQLPPPQASYTPPGYAPPPGQPPSAPGQASGYPYAPPGYPGQQGYPQSPQPYPGAPTGYPGQPDQQGQGQPPQYPTYPPPGYPQAAGYAQQPGAYGQGYPTYAPAAAPAAGTTLRLFGQSISLPVALPPAVVQYQKQIVYGAVGLLALLIVLFGITPSVASGQIATGNQALVMAASHQPKVDAVFVQLIGAQTNSIDPNTMKAQFDKLSTSFNNGLTLVQSDEAALKSSDQRLSILQWVTPSKGTEIAAERHRIAAALAGLSHADIAMTAAVNQAKVIQPFIDALIDYTKMGTALGKHDLVGAGALYPDAQAKMQTAISLASAPGLPPQIAKQMSSFNDVLTNTESLIQAIQAKNAADIKKYTDLANAALKAMSSPAETLPADYASKTFGPMQKTYDAAMKAIASS